MFEMVTTIVNLIIRARIVFIYLGINRERGIPLCEVKFTDREVAIRKNLLEKERGEKYIAN